jgi:predicted amidohydrolase
MRTPALREISIKAFSGLKIALAQFSVQRAEVDSNLAKIGNLAADAAGRGASLLVLPEMATTGFDWKYNRAILDQAETYVRALGEIASEHRIAIVGSFLRATETCEPANTLLYFDQNGSILSEYRKIHLFTLFHEERHMQAGEKPVVLDTGAAVLGFSICYDLRFPELYRKTTEMGAQVQILPAAFPHPRLEHWRTLVRARAIENQSYFVAVNQCGKEGHGGKVGPIHYFGNSQVVDPWGEIVAEAGEREELLPVEIDIDLVKQIREKLPSFRDRRPGLFSPRGI